MASFRITEVILPFRRYAIQFTNKEFVESGRRQLNVPGVGLYLYTKEVITYGSIYFPHL
jgi:hypothetical protein